MLLEPEFRHHPMMESCRPTFFSDEKHHNNSQKKSEHHPTARSLAFSIRALWFWASVIRYPWLTWPKSKAPSSLKTGLRPGKGRLQRSDNMRILDWPAGARPAEGWSFLVRAEWFGTVRTLLTYPKSLLNSKRIFEFLMLLYATWTRIWPPPHDGILSWHVFFWWETS